ncbi:hypothetical protein KL86DYS1_11923 [uncultured Dysgonomonas sp.]|uniref:Uncharacterized protein n=1 Tax=uncultured Dysgonomonas sp. TaxID=206096 RepID=A0A212JDK4_9BACT|nr:hypothetical protein KL86DYS1_11923 [uncultured Dysgonomonas sp.]
MSNIHYTFVYIKNTSQLQAKSGVMRDNKKPKITTKPLLM